MKRIVTIQDISCFGKCSLTVALPIISAMGVETAVVPTAVLSTHTGGFSGFTFRDLSGDIPGIFNNPFIIWGKYRRKLFGVYLPISFQFHHTQMDGAHAGKFLKNLQDEINRL